MMEYCCHIWAGARSCYLELFPSYINGYVELLFFHLLPLWSPWLIIKMQPAKVLSVGIILVDAHQNWLIQFQLLIFEGGCLVVLIDCMIFLSPFLDVLQGCLCQQFHSLHSYTSEFSAYTMLSYDLSGFKSRINRHLLTLGSF